MNAVHVYKPRNQFLFGVFSIKLNPLNSKFLTKLRKLQWFPNQHFRHIKLIRIAVKGVQIACLIQRFTA